MEFLYSYIDFRKIVFLIDKGGPYHFMWHFYDRSTTHWYCTYSTYSRDGILLLLLPCSHSRNNLHGRAGTISRGKLMAQRIRGGGGGGERALLHSLAWPGQLQTDFPAFRNERQNTTHQWTGQEQSYTREKRVMQSSTAY